MGPLPPEMTPNMNGMSNPGESMDGMKNSPANGPGTPREDGPALGEYGMPYEENDQNESAAIKRIKESMQEEAKRFEKETPDHSESYFMQ